jgi:hypothetical protein
MDQVKFFKAFNPDFINQKDEFIYNIINTSKINKRIVKISDFYKKYSTFDPKFYKESYSDLKKLDIYQLHLHYYNFGHKEERIINKDVYLKKLGNFYNVNLSKDMMSLLKLNSYTNVEIFDKYPCIYMLNYLKRNPDYFQNFNYSCYKVNSKQQEKIINNFFKNKKDVNLFFKNNYGFDICFFYLFNEKKIVEYLKTKKLEFELDNVISAFIDFKLNNYDFLESLSFLLNLKKV